MVVGKPVILAGGGDGSNTLVASVWGVAKTTSSSPHVIGSGSVAAVVVDADYFTNASGVLTCNKAGTYNISIFARGTRYNGGSTTCNYDLMQNGTAVASERSISNSPGVVNAYSVTLAAGDTLSLEAFGSNSSGTVGASMTITL